MRTLVGFATLGLGLVALGLLALTAASARPDGPEKDMATTARVTSRSPVIDQRAPARTETATFALG
jgi:hypothetical protein